MSILLYTLCVTWFPYSVIPGNHYCSVSRLIMTIIVFREVKPVTIINYMSTHHAGHAAIKSTKRDWEIHAHLVISSQLGFYPEIEVWGLAASCTQLHARTTYIHVPWVSLKYACVYCYIYTKCMYYYIYKMNSVSRDGGTIIGCLCIIRYPRVHHECTICRCITSSWSCTVMP